MLSNKSMIGIYSTWTEIAFYLIGGMIYISIPNVREQIDKPYADFFESQPLTDEIRRDAYAIGLLLVMLFYPIMIISSLLFELLAIILRSITR